MEYKYTINEISETVKISKPSLYGLIKKNSAFIKDNSIRKQRRVYYNDAVMDFFISYYHPEQSADIGKKEFLAETIDIKVSEAEKSPLESSYKEEEQQARIDALQAEITALKKQLEAKEAERLELLRQNGALILTLQQSQQEKMLLLPPPKKSFSDKVKSIFKSKQKEK